MKKYIYFVMAFAISLLSACNPDPSEPDSPEPSFDLTELQKEWKLDTWQGDKAEFDLYLHFRGDNTFTIYQQIETVRFLTYSGTYSVEDSEIRGQYSDGQSWGDKYTLTFENGRMLMTSQQETSLYKECKIPASVKENSEEYEPTKSFGDYWL